MAYRSFKDLLGRTAADKVLHDKAFNIAKHLISKRFSFNSLKTFLTKRLQVVLLKIQLYKIMNSLKNYTNQLLENLKNGKYTHLLLIIFGVLI